MIPEPYSVIMLLEIIGILVEIFIIIDKVISLKKNDN